MLFFKLLCTIDIKNIFPKKANIKHQWKDVDLIIECLLFFIKNVSLKHTETKIHVEHSIEA